MLSKGTRLQELMSYCYDRKIAMTYLSIGDRIFISICSTRNKRYSNQNGTNLNKVIDSIWTDIKHIKIW